MPVVRARSINGYVESTGCGPNHYCYFRSDRRHCHCPVQLPIFNTRTQ